MRPIFIICQHRTGSTLLKNILNKHSNINMAFDEMNLYEPYRKNTLDKLVQKVIKSPDDFLKAIDNKQIYGSFWKDISKWDFDKKKFFKSLNNLKILDEMEILNQILISLKDSKDNIFPGVKYPIHFSKIKKLKERFKDSKMIFLTRNPKAIISSKLNDPATIKRKSKSLAHSFFVHYFTLIYFCLEYNKSIKQFSKYNKIGFQLSYEDLVECDGTIEKICEYLGVNYDKKMLNVNGKNSSYTQSSKITNSKLFSSSVNKYLEVLSPFDLWLINTLTRKNKK